MPPAGRRDRAGRGRKTGMLDVVLDLSHYNPVTSWAQIRQAAIVGVIHKATEGTTTRDETYAARQPEALAAGLLFGAYHFGRAGDPMGQAAHFLDVAQPTAETLLVLDWESCGAEPSMSLREAEQFVCAVYAGVGRWPGLYSGMSFCQDALVDVRYTVLSLCFLWLARYDETPPEVPPAWETWSLWQWTDHGTVPGIEGPVDRNRWNGDLAGLARLWGRPPGPAPG
jgi:lysozyme